MTVTGSSMSFCSALARSASSISVRRASPNCLPSASISRMTRRFIDDGFSSRSCSEDFSLRSSASSCWILIASSRASWRSRISRMSSAWRSDRLNAVISAGLGSSDWRMMRMTSSMLSSTASRPSRMWMRSSTFCSRKLERRVMVVKRNAIHSFRMLQQRLLPRPAVAADHHQVDRRARLERGVRQQRLHELGLVLVLGLGFEHQPHRRVAPGFVAHRVQHGKHGLLHAPAVRATAPSCPA